ncbi:hypothetical protein Dimus_036757 [Dionaea muscipula]
MTMNLTKAAKHVRRPRLKVINQFQQGESSVYILWYWQQYKISFKSFISQEYQQQHFLPPQQYDVFGTIIVWASNWGLGFRIRHQFEIFMPDMTYRVRENGVSNYMKLDLR